MLSGLLGMAVGAVVSAGAPTVTVDHGNIVLKGTHDDIKLTSSGHDSDPALSPDGKVVVFTREGGPSPSMAGCDANEKPGIAIELWSVNADGSNPTKLLEGHGGKKVEDNVCDFASKQFNTAGTLLYFETPAYATSDAVHVLDMASRQERFFIPGNSLKVLAGCKNDDYRDTIVAAQHRYFVFGGSYDWFYLFKPDGKEVGPVGEKDASATDEACS